jgi:hypothetical protein
MEPWKRSVADPGAARLCQGNQQYHQRTSAGIDIADLIELVRESRMIARTKADVVGDPLLPGPASSPMRRGRLG